MKNKERQQPPKNPSPKTQVRTGTDTDPKTGITAESGTDVFKCLDCGKKKTRSNILKFFTHLPFSDEYQKTYYCGCKGFS
jgi:hypothetical protein